MGLLPVSLQPGIYTEATPRSALNRFKDGNNVRFFKGRMEKIAGCQKLIATTIYGICRSLVSWTTLEYQRLIALGTNSKLYLSDATSFFDITPVRRTGTLGANPFTMVNTSKTVTVHDVTHGASVGDFVNFSGAGTVRGIVIDGDHQIDVVIDADNYSFTAATPATSSGTGGGGAVAYIYDIMSGSVDSVAGSGWGAGGWGTGTWGTPRVSLFLTLARIWSLCNWGEDLIASPIGQPIYVWLATGGTGVRAVLIAAAPAQNRKVLVSEQLRIMVSFGSHDGTDPDPMLIRWCDSENYTDWTPAPTNLAGDKRLDNGSEIIGVVISRDEFAVITDTTVYSMTLSGDNLVFAFASKGACSGLVGPNAAVDIDGTVYCCGRGQFYTYDGQINLLPCDVHSRVFGTEIGQGGINIDQAAKCYMARNKLKTEWIMFFPSGTATECNMCVGYNYADQTWWLGDIVRTAWLDENTFFIIPISTRPDGSVDPAVNSIMLIQETGLNNDDGSALEYFAKTYDLEIGATSNLVTGDATGAGEVVYDITHVIPDFQRIAGRHALTMTGRKKPNGKDIVKGPKGFDANTTRIDMHIRSRQISLEISGDAVDSDIAVGAWRVNASARGRR